jgi:hypothetical protein
VLDGDLELVGGLCEMAADAGDDLVKAMANSSVYWFWSSNSLSYPPSVY